MRLSRLFLGGICLLILAGLLAPRSSAVAAELDRAPLTSATIDQVAPAPVPPGSGRLIPTPVYGNLGLALVVFTGGTVDDLEVAAGSVGASGVWVQDASGRFQLLPVQGPAFVKSTFSGAFAPASPGAPNFTQMIAVTLIAPAVTPPPVTVTQAQNGTTLSLNIGDRFLLMLGSAVAWNVQIADPGTVSRVPNVAVVSGAQGIYQANQAGNTTLSATGTPICAAGTACPQYIIQFSIAITVLPASGTSGIQGTVTLGPITPVCQVSVPCDSPYQATLTINNANGATAGQVKSGADGRYSITLPPGHYTVVPLSPTGQTLPRASAMQVDVVAGQFATVNIQYDTGIR